MARKPSVDPPATARPTTVDEPPTARPTSVDAARLDRGWGPSALRSALIRLASTTLARLPPRVAHRVVLASLGSTLELGPTAFALRSRAGLTTTDRELDHHLASLFPDRDPVARSRLTSGIQTHDTLAILTRRLRESLGDAWLEALVRPRDQGAFVALREAQRPTIVLSWHTGSSAGLVTGLARLEREVAAAAPRAPRVTPPLVLRYELGRVPDGWAQVAADHDPIARGKTLHLALKTLRSGSLVVILLDAMRPNPDYPHPSVAFIGRAVRTSPGPAWLARMSGATLVPAHATWRLDRAPYVDLAFGPPITHPDPHAPDPDLAHTRALYAYFESQLRADPSTLWPKSLRHLARCPRV